MIWIRFITALAEALGWEEVARCQLALRGVCSTGERGLPRPHRGWKSETCVLAASPRTEQKAPVRETVWKDRPDLLAALWRMCLLCNPAWLWTNAGLCVCLPRSKNFVDSHSFPRKYYIKPIYIFNAHRQTAVSLLMLHDVLHQCHFILFFYWTQIRSNYCGEVIQLFINLKYLFPNTVTLRASN